MNLSRPSASAFISSFGLHHVMINTNPNIDSTNSLVHLNYSGRRYQWLSSSSLFFLNNLPIPNVLNGSS